MVDKCQLCEGKGTYFDEGTFPCPECNIKETRGYIVAAARIRELEAVLARKDAALEKCEARERDVIMYFQSEVAMLLSGRGQLYLDGLAIFDRALIAKAKEEKA